MSGFDESKIYDQYGQIDFFEIQREASQIRAKAMREMFSWLKARFSVVPTVVAIEA